MENRVELFQRGHFRFNSGQLSEFKFECDALSDAEMGALVFLASLRIPRFSNIVSVPKGKSNSEIDNAKRLAVLLEPYKVPWGDLTLIVDDVFTTGGSLDGCRRDYLANNPPTQALKGLVLFSYIPTPAWIVPLLTLAPRWRA